MCFRRSMIFKVPFYKDRNGFNDVGFNDLGTYWHPHADVSGVVPPSCIYCLFRLFGIVGITLENVGAFDAHFALVVFRPVFHFGDVDQFDTVASHGWTHVSGDVVALDG